MYPQNGNVTRTAHVPRLINISNTSTNTKISGGVEAELIKTILEYSTSGYFHPFSVYCINPNLGPVYPLNGNVTPTAHVPRLINISNISTNIKISGGVEAELN